MLPVISGVSGCCSTPCWQGKWSNIIHYIIHSGVKFLVIPPITKLGGYIGVTIRSVGQAVNLLQKVCVAKFFLSFKVIQMKLGTHDP